MKNRHKSLWLSIKRWFLRCCNKSISNRRKTDKLDFTLCFQEHSQESEKTTYRLLLLFSREVVSDSLRPHGLQHTRLPCPLLSPRVCSNARPLSWWCYLTIFSSAHQVAKVQTGRPCLQIMHLIIGLCLCMNVHAKSLQFCLILCDPMDCSLPGCV